MKFLCVCNSGNTRSVAMARIIKRQNPYWHHSYPPFDVENEAIAIGAHQLGKGTRMMMIEWADKVISLCEDEETKEWLKTACREKYFDADIGADRFGTPDNPELLMLCRQKFKQCMGWK